MKKKPPLGLTNRIKIVENNLVKKSLRINDAYLNRVNEQNFYRQAQGWDFTKIPAKFGKTWKGQWMSMMPYWQNAKTLPKTKLTDQQLHVVIHLIEKLHQKNIELIIFNPEAFLNFFTKRVGVLKALAPLEDKIEKIIYRYYLDDRALVPSHNDLIRENFLTIDGKTYLIDFEYATLNHPLFDYASFITESLSPAEERSFEGFLKLSDIDLKKLHEIELYQDYLWAHWAEYLYRKTKKITYREIREQKIQNALKRTQKLVK